MGDRLRWHMVQQMHGSKCTVGMSAIDMIEADLNFMDSTTTSWSTTIADKAQKVAKMSRTRSVVPCSTHIYESAAIDGSMEDIWSSIRNLDFAHNDLMSGGELVGGECGHQSVTMVGSVHKLHFVDGAEWTIQIQEVSDFAHRLVFDLLERNDGVEVASCMHEISLTNITQGNSTLVEYTVDYSNDVDAQVCQDTQFKRKQELEQMQEYFARK